MHLREDMVEKYLSYDNPTPFDVAHLASDLDDTPTLRMSHVVDIWCYRSGVHEFLLFRLESQKSRRKFWMRLDRMPQFVRKALRASKRTPAHDTFRLNYSLKALLVGEEMPPKLIVALTNLSHVVSMSHIVLLMSIIRDASTMWELVGTNCRWFCAVTLDSLQRQFGGEYMTSTLHDGLATFRGFDNPATQRVRELYQPRFQPDPNGGGMSSAIFVANTVSVAVVDAMSRNEADLSGVPGMRLDQLGSTEEMRVAQRRANEFSRRVQCARLRRVVDTLNDLSSAFDTNMSESTLLAMQFVADCEEMWECLCYHLVGANGQVSAELAQRVLKITLTWVKHCRLPRHLLGEIRQLSAVFSNLADAEGLTTTGRELSAALNSIMIFGLNEPSEFHLPTSGSFLDISPERTAGLLRRMEVEIRSRYLESEHVALYSLHCTLQDSANFNQGWCVLPFSEVVTIWVKTSVISAKDTGKRVQAVKHFVQIAKECYKQHNFATTISIANALQELNIRALKVTNKGVGEKNIKAIEKLGLECRNHPGRSGLTWRPSPVVKPLKLNTRHETIQQLKALKNNSQEALSVNDLVTKLCPEDSLKPHRMQDERVKTELRMCNLLILTSMEEACRQWDQSKESSYLIQLQKDEVIEFERMRSSVIF